MIAGSAEARSGIIRHSALWEQTYQPLPWEVIGAALDAAADRKKADADWAELRAAVAKGEGTNFRFDSGTKTREHLYHEHGPLGRLAALARDRDAAGVQAWLGALPADLGDFLDDASRAALGSGGQLIIGKARRGYLEKLRVMVDAARIVAARARPATAPEERRRLERARTFARALAHERDGLAVEALALTGPDRAVLERVWRQDLRPVAEWGAV